MEELGRFLQLLLGGGTQVRGAEESHDGMAHVSDTPAHGGLPHTEEGADGAVLDVGRETPQGHGHAFLYRQRQPEACVLARQAGPQLLAQVEEGLPAHPEFVQPIRGLELRHHNPLPPVGAGSGCPGSGADADVGAHSSRYHHLSGHRQKR